MISTIYSFNRLDLDFRKVCTLFVWTLILPYFAHAQEPIQTETQIINLSPSQSQIQNQNLDIRSEAQPSSVFMDTSTLFTYKSERTRKYILLPALASFVLPGFDQWVTGQVAPGMLYSGYAMVGYIGFSITDQKITDENIPSKDTSTEGGVPTDPTHQLRSLSSQATLAAGFMSAYHSFRTYAETSGDRRYEYIKNNGDTIEDIMLAPFKFKFLKRSTTYLPLLLGAALLVAAEHKDMRSIDGSHTGFILGTSYQAGVGEEAFFRGFLYPYMTTSLNSNFWGNVLSSTLFGAAHISSDNPFPLFQTAFGMYDAYVTKKNNWSIQESIFLHFWWDVLAFSIAYSTDTNNSVHHRKTLLNIMF